MTRDGLVERNAATGEESRVSQRRQDFDLRQSQPESQNTAHGDTRTGHMRQRPQNTPHEQPGQPENPQQGAPLPQNTPPQNRKQHNNQHRGRLTEDTPPPEQPAFSTPEKMENSTQNTTNPIHEAEPYKQSPHQSAARHSGENPQKTHPNGTANASKSPDRTKRPGRLQFAEEQPQDTVKKKPRQHGTKYQQKFVPEVEKLDDATTPEKNVAPDVSAPPPGKTGRLQFTADELPPDPDHKLSKLKGKAEKADHKLDKARKKLPSKRKAKIERVFDEEKGKAKHKLKFEKEVIPQGGKKKSLPARAGKAAGGAAMRTGANAIHKKINEVEKENVGIEAAHRTELAAEGIYRGGRSALRFTRNRRYRAAAKLEKKAVKANAKYAYQKMLAENPKLKSNLLSRLAQKQKIKRQYAKAAREAKRAGQTAKKAGSATAKAARAVTNLIRSHPMIAGAIVLILLLVFFMFTMFSSCSNMAGGLMSVVMSTYPSRETEMLAVEAAYTGLEADLQQEIDGIETTYPNYDEYRYDLAYIGHDPHQLAAYLSAVYQEYTLAEVRQELDSIFDTQYTLTLTEIVEVRYRTETRTDADGNSYTVQVPYNYYILNVKLQNNGLDYVAQTTLTAEQKQMYDIYQETKGNMPLLFGGGSVNISPSEDLSGVHFVNGTRTGNQAVVDIAKSQVGNVGGQPYWSWYGFEGRVEWCACFVSWCINQAGYSEPRFAGCTSGGMGWFKSHGQWAAGGYSDIAPGDLIFFDWDNSGDADHVGIVIGKDATHVYTVEGNSGDACKIRSYPLDSGYIIGYGLMNW